MPQDGMTYHYINLTNGLEWLRELSARKIEPRFCRIQSTALEQKRFGFVISDLENELIFHWVHGSKIHIYDASEKRDVTRALWQGTVWIQYVLTRHFHGVDALPAEVWTRRCDVRSFFDRMYGIHRETMDKKLKYFRIYAADIPGQIIAHSRNSCCRGNRTVLSAMIGRTDETPEPFRGRSVRVLP